MDVLGQAASNYPCLSGGEDILFFRLFSPNLTRVIFRTKYNDPECRRMCLRHFCWSTGLNVTPNERVSAWRRLGNILGRNTTLEALLINCDINPDVAAMCDGLQSNRSIQTLDLSGINLQDEEKMKSFAPFLHNNPSLKDIALWNCNLGPASINILSNTLSNRSEDTLKCLNLSNNDFGVMDLDQLVVALIKCRNLRMLCLDGNGIGLRGCRAIAKLLGNQESSLERLDLYGNSLNNDCVVTLTDSLANNTKLRVLGLLENNGITNKGWSTMPKLVSNSSSVKDVMESNHTLQYVGYLSDHYKKVMDLDLGVDNANLFRACLRLNKRSNKQLVTRSKTIWSHARGNLNLGDYSIDTGVMPRILSWFGDDSNETNANLTQYHDPPLPKAKIDSIRLDSIFRILRSMPALLKMCNQDEQVLGPSLREDYHSDKRRNNAEWCILWKKHDDKRKLAKLNPNVTDLLGNVPPYRTTEDTKENQRKEATKKSRSTVFATSPVQRLHLRESKLGIDFTATRRRRMKSYKRGIDATANRRLRTKSVTDIGKAKRASIMRKCRGLPNSDEGVEACTTQ